MTYTLHRLAAGSYDLILDGTVVGSVVRDALPGGGVLGWHAELLDDRPDAVRPAPFTAAEHKFSTFEEARDWLGKASIINEPGDGALH